MSPYLFNIFRYGFLQWILLSANFIVWLLLYLAGLNPDSSPFKVALRLHTNNRTTIWKRSLEGNWLWSSSFILLMRSFWSDKLQACLHLFWNLLQKHHKLMNVPIFQTRRASSIDLWNFYEINFFLWNGKKNGKTFLEYLIWLR